MCGQSRSTNTWFIESNYVPINSTVRYLSADTFDFFTCHLTPTTKTFFYVNTPRDENTVKVYSSCTGYTRTFRTSLIRQWWIVLQNGKLMINPSRWVHDQSFVCARTKISNGTFVIKEKRSIRKMMEYISRTINSVALTATKNSSPLIKLNQ